MPAPAPARIIHQFPSTMLPIRRQAIRCLFFNFSCHVPRTSLCLFTSRSRKLSRPAIHECVMGADRCCSMPQAYQQAPAYSHSSWPAQQSTHTAAHTYPAEPSTHRTELQPEAAHLSSAQQVLHHQTTAAAAIADSIRWTVCQEHAAVFCRFMI